MGQHVTCPTCGHHYSLEDFMCPRCERILNDSAVSQVPLPDAWAESSLVARLLAPPDKRLNRKPRKDGGPLPAHDELSSPTVVMGQRQYRTGVPVIIAGLEVVDQKLTRFEAELLGRMNGRATIVDLQQAVGVTGLEMQVVIENLERKGVVRLDPMQESLLPSTLLEEYEQQPPPPPLPRSSLGLDVGPPTVRTRAADLDPAFEPVTKATPRPAAASQARAAKPESDDGSALQKAVRLEQSGDIVGALAVLERAIKHSKKPAPLLNRLAVVLLKERRDYARAEKLLNQAVELDPSSDVYRNNLYKVLCMAAVGRGGTPPRPDERKSTRAR